MRIHSFNYRRYTDIVKVSLSSGYFFGVPLIFIQEYAQAVDFVDRAIFTYERAFIGAFNFTSGMNRLEFDRVENRPFFLAVHRQITCVHIPEDFRRSIDSILVIYSAEAVLEQRSNLLDCCIRWIHGTTRMARYTTSICSRLKVAWRSG
jgi:hypothetical protein